MATESFGRIRIRRDPYMAAWSRFRWRRAALALGVAAFLAVAAPLAGMEVAPAGLEAGYILFAIVLAIPGALLLLAAIPPFACPQCTRPFSRRTRRELAADRNCAHCGIAVGTPEY